MATQSKGRADATGAVAFKAQGGAVKPPSGIRLRRAAGVRDSESEAIISLYDDTGRHDLSQCIGRMT